MTHPAEEFFTRHNGPVEIAGGCNLCKHVDVVKKLPAGQAGRGWGMREGNKQRGRLVQHVKAEHPDALTGG